MIDLLKKAANSESFKKILRKAKRTPIIANLIKNFYTIKGMFADIGESYGKSPTNLVIQWINLIMSFILFFIALPDLASTYISQYDQIPGALKYIVSGIAAYLVGELCPITLSKVFRTKTRTSIRLLTFYVFILTITNLPLAIQALKRSLHLVGKFLWETTSKISNLLIRITIRSLQTV